MSEENSVTWLCQRCGRRQDIELETDPVLLRVCDSCKIENWTRPVKGVIEDVPLRQEDIDYLNAEEPEPEKALEVSTGIASPEIMEMAEIEEAILEAKTKGTEIARLKAELAELEK